MADLSDQLQLDESRHDNVFDVDAERLARVYAQAGLDAAGDLSAQGSLAEELNSVVADVLEKHSEMEEIFRSELISKEEKLELLDHIFSGKASESLLNLLKVMTKHGRLGMVRDVARSAFEMWEDRAGKVRVQLELPKPIDDALQNEILASLGKVLGADPQVETSINPDLLAGFVVRVGDKVYDASVRTRLEKSHQSMVVQAIEAIQQHPEQFIDRTVE
ncbi:ATP synthase F1 subunit delta [Adhaeretor mobilis]|uniref:ATP synthase subunit delta n=1 Tax=Adhaeretor mobilis TaxID=1930276 RepID=A0A517MXT1_9BACT|nr:ATP synthase F1 subunit delta [Adhaeretor mobilis]QDS99688.1 ATP synthase subunit delta, sodium ion specific [Adhaeretor mobilis]